MGERKFRLRQLKNGERKNQGKQLNDKKSNQIVCSQHKEDNVKQLVSIPLKLGDIVMFK